jgi:Uma2 family endonuclease
MIPQTARNLPITAAEYLEGERKSDVRHEFVDGRIYAMSGASIRHNMIAGEAYSMLKDHLRGGPCRTLIEAVKVQLADDIGEAYYYPDVFVTCEPGDDDTHVVRCPKLIIEVLSESTSRIDRGDKLTNYRRIPSVEEIVLIEQDWPEIVVYRRSDGWKRHLHTQLETMVRLESVGFAAPLSSFYQSAPFPPDVQRPWYHTNRVDD